MRRSDYDETKKDHKWTKFKLALKCTKEMYENFVFFSITSIVLRILMEHIVKICSLEFELSFDLNAALKFSLSYKIP